MGKNIKSMLTKIENFINKHNLIQHNETIVIGLSGGPDSVFLLHYLVLLQKKYNLKLIAAHLNHEWRAESPQEEILCRSIAQKHNIIFASAKLSELSHAPKYNGSQEEHARTMRRFFLRSIAKTYNAHRIALGHHAQDQQETFFIRLIRGSSLTGLTAIKAQNGLYIRPLLETNKKDIVTWLTKNNIKYATDASNESQLYLRNRIRTKVLPALNECDQRFDTNFLNTLNRLKNAELFLEKTACTAFESISSKENDTYHVNTHLLAAIDTALHHRIIIHWLILANVPFPTTQTFLDEILRFLLSARGGTHHMHPLWAIYKKKNTALIIVHESQENTLIETNTK